MSTPDETFVEDVLAHGRKQLEKGWPPLSTARNLRARYGLTEDCGKRIVGAMMASRVGPPVERLAGELVTALELSMEEATARVMEVRMGHTDPDDWTTIHLDFDPGRAPSFAPSAAEAGVWETPSHSSAGGLTTRLRGPIRIEVNLLPEQGERKRGGLFGLGGS